MTFLRPVDDRDVDMHEYREVVTSPMDLGTVMAGVAGGREYAPPPAGRGVAGFAEDVRRTFDNGMRFNDPVDHPVHVTAKALLGRFECLMLGEEAIVGAPTPSPPLRERPLVPRLESFAAQGGGISDDDCDANDAAVAMRKRRAALLPSAATLVVVPAPLLSHWREQLSRHVDWRYVRFAPPAATPGGEGAATPATTTTVGGTFDSCVVIDDAGDRQRSGGRGGGAPSAEEMARALVVVTNIERLSAEQQRMEREQERHEELAGDGGIGRGGGGRACVKRTARDMLDGTSRAPSPQRQAHADDRLWAATRSPFQRVHWLRLVLDEGHVLGSCALTSFGRLLDGVDAERTWAMTGTPTRDTGAGVALRNLFGLLRFLRHAPFGRSETRGIDGVGRMGPGGGRRGWNEIVAEPYAAGRVAAEMRLSRLLRGLMVRNTKEDVPEIPSPLRRTVRLYMSTEEREAYNTRLTFIRTNIVLTEKPDGRLQQESLLHVSNSSDLTRQTKFLRMLCCGGGAQMPSIAEAARAETHAILAGPPCPHPECLDKPRGSHHAKWRGGGGRWHACPKAIRNRRALIGFDADVDVRGRVERFIGRAITGRRTLCGRCGIALFLQLVTPCGHFLCPECAEVALRTRFEGRPSRARYIDAESDKIIWEGSCAECDYDFTFDELQLLQPGFMVDWKEQLQEANRERSWNNTAAQTTAASARAMILANPTFGAASTAGASGSTQGDASGDTDGGASVGPSPGDVTVEGSSAAAQHVQGGVKSAHIISRLRTLRMQQRNMGAGRRSPGGGADGGSPFRPGVRPKERSPRREDTRVAADESGAMQGPAPIKAIVFSQFRQPLNIVGHDLIMAFGQDAVAEFFGAYRNVELDKFRTGMLILWRCEKCAHENQTVERSCQRPVAVLRFAVPARAEAHSPAFVDVHVPADSIVDHFLGRTYRRGESVVLGSHATGPAANFVGQTGRVENIRKCGRKRGQAPTCQRRTDCFVMILSNDGAVGLDLSFVTHIFLLDKIFNPALEKQVIARAHRMGATQSVVVEQLLARDTVEEMRADAGDDENQRKLLAGARLLRPPDSSAQKPRKSRCTVTWG